MTAINQGDQEQLLRIKQVMQMVPVARSTVWQWVKDGKFPQPTKAGSCTFWRMSDVQAWIGKQSKVV